MEAGESAGDRRREDACLKPSPQSSSPSPPAAKVRRQGGREATEERRIAKAVEERSFAEDLEAMKKELKRRGSEGMSSWMS